MKNSTFLLLISELVLFLLFPKYSYPQSTCTFTEAEFAAGGTFGETCVLEVGNNITITGDVIWTGGTLTIEDNPSPGDIIIAASGSLTVNAGTVQTGDITDGSLEVNGDLTIASGATVSIHDEIHIENGGTADISGRLERLEAATGPITSSIFIDGGGSITVNSTGVLSTNSSTVPEGGSGFGSWDALYVEGTLVSAGTIYAMDFVMNGTDGEGTAQILNGGVVNANDNLQVYNGGEITIEFGATVNAADDVYNDNGLAGPDFPFGTQGLINVYGDLNVGGDLTIYNTTPDSGLLGGGTIDVSGTYADNECPGVGDFCSCLGSPVISCSGIGPLPVTWTSFSVQLSNSGEALLEWATATEINNEGFYVEKSQNGIEFTMIGFVEGQGNSTELNSYTYSDPELFSGYYYYRLKQVDYDGAYEYSKLVVLYVDGLKLNRQVVVYPNPTTGEIQLLGLVDDSYNLLLYSNTGQVLLHAPAIRMRNIEEVINTKLPLLEQGIYNIRLENSLQVSNLKLVLN